MLRRPPGEGRRPSQQQKLLFAFAIILLPWLQLVDAQQQQPAAAEPGIPQLRRPGGSSQQIAEDAPVHQWAATPIDAAEATRETANNIRRASTLKQHQPQQNPPSDRKNRKNEYENVIIPHDASALATLAPAEAVRAPNPSRHHRPRSVHASGLTQQQIARSLKDWEVEDFVLLATVDGDLYANDRRTGKERWHLEVDQPMVETTHHRADSSILDEDYNAVDHYVWAVEPNRDGGIYMWIPDSKSGLIRTGFSMKTLVELAPYADDKPPVVYTGDKKTTMITLDAATGRVLKWFGSTGSHVNEAESCLRPDTLYAANSQECSSTGTITLGRTEYTVGIQRRDGHPIATLKYSEWSPNNYDSDLYQQHQSSLDSKYITSQHDGKVYAFDYARTGEPEPLFIEHFSAPVARVFDVCRPWDATLESNPDLVVLPQPPMPSQDENHARMRTNSIFLNQTRGGSWFAMSGRSYPLITNAPIAQISLPTWWDIAPAWDTINQTRLSKALAGTHFLNSNRPSGHHPPTLPSGSIEEHDDPEIDPAVPAVADASNEPAIITTVKALPQNAAKTFTDFLSNPIVIIIFISTLIANQKKLRRGYNRMRTKGFMNQLHHLISHPLEQSSEDADDSQASDKEADEIDTPTESTTGKKTADQLEAKLREKKLEEPPVPAPESSKLVPDEGISQPAVNDVDWSDREATPTPAKSAAKAKAGIFAEGLADENGAQNTAINGDQTGQKSNNQNGAPPEKKKKAHRGRRGGVKHRKGRAGELSQSRGDDPGPGTVEDAVNNAKKLGDRPSLEADTITVANDMSSVTGPIIRMGNIEVNTDEQLGTGSNGTLVFAGKFDGREVAVKRMLIQFYDIASQETKLLRESDDHPNVIRYYSQQMRDGFLYIALERCAASLADVVEKPDQHKALANAGRRDLPNILYQITNGIGHLHELRIVHRDLKPQNILVNMSKDGKPRMLVSDFGLCKKLEGGQSSFGATTGRAAGTSGWRAPELLLDDDARDGGGMMEVSQQSGSGSALVLDNGLPGNRRATRAIDIFSLGLVFFYVLTNGSHPFDCGSRYMREVNIRKGNYNLDLLDSLGDFAFEAKDLIGSMLQADPKNRPSAKDIMAHPFFWSAKKRLAFLCDVSDHFEKEPRDPPSPPLMELERHAAGITRHDFLRVLPAAFVDSLGKQRKYTGSKLLDLLRALRNKRNHYEDMSESLKRIVGPLPEGYLAFWTVKFPMLLLTCWDVVYEVEWYKTDRFREYYEPVVL
ncbi:IRE kinase [Fusarium albosuccineum]|uniref:non-specific serine/threonine protein kinase n=1 Tax=Fusarium albosuccineum TaxID=1237068 RepID=A0A8H4L2B3_9HYPO|nr:IRE kinase [Fusarium albosuccineum]